MSWNAKVIERLVVGMIAEDDVEVSSEFQLLWLAVSASSSTSSGGPMSMARVSDVDGGGAGSSLATPASPVATVSFGGGLGHDATGLAGAVSAVSSSDSEGEAARPAAPPYSTHLVGELF